jgi:hypothetical protein
MAVCSGAGITNDSFIQQAKGQGGGQEQRLVVGKAVGDLQASPAF